MVLFICNLEKAEETLKVYFNEGKQLNLHKANLRGNMDKKIVTECYFAELIHRTQNKRIATTLWDGKGIWDGCAKWSCSDFSSHSRTDKALRNIGGEFSQIKLMLNKDSRAAEKKW